MMPDIASHLSDEQLSAHIDDRLPQAEASVAAAHLTVCDACRSALIDLETTVHLLRALPDLAPPRSFRVEPSAPSLWARISQWDLGVRGLAAAAAAVFVVMVSGDLLGPTGVPAALPTPTALAGAVAPRSAPAPARFSATLPPAPTSVAGGAASAPASEKPAVPVAAPATGEPAPPAADSARVQTSQPAAKSVESVPAESGASEAAPSRPSQTSAPAGASAGDGVGAIRLTTVMAGLVALALGALAIIRARRRA